jgi:hypothetical protein
MRSIHNVRLPKGRRKGKKNLDKEIAMKNVFMFMSITV